MQLVSQFPFMLLRLCSCTHVLCEVGTGGSMSVGGQMAVSSHAPALPKPVLALCSLVSGTASGVCADCWLHPFRPGRTTASPSGLRFYLGPQVVFTGKPVDARVCSELWGLNVSFHILHILLRGAEGKCPGGPRLLLVALT